MSDDDPRRDGAAPTGIRRRREPHDVRRDQILDAAERVLLDRGLPSTTIAEVAEAGGVAKGTVYLYFESRTQLLAELRARHVDRFKSALEAALEGPPRTKPATRLDRFVDRFFEYAMGHRQLHHMLFHEAGFSEADGFAAVRAQLARFVAAGIAAGDFRPADSDLVADYALAGIHGALVSALHAGPGDARRHLAGAKEMTRRLLVGGAA